ncbi:MAG: FMN-dependent NADH-azoreductase [Elainellaceae cyanobacterium]
MRTILRVDASAHRSDSRSRALGDRLSSQLQQQHPQARVIHRDLAQGVPLLTEEQITARETLENQRTPEQQAILRPSENLIKELKAADTLILTTPIYNFSIPAALKAYIDQVCRPRLTFRYTEDGPLGLIDCRAYLIIISGGTPLNSEVDFATGYLKHILSFMGIEDIEVIGADGLLAHGEARLVEAQRQIDAAVAQAGS